MDSDQNLYILVRFFVVSGTSLTRRMNGFCKTASWSAVLPSEDLSYVYAVYLTSRHPLTDR